MEFTLEEALDIMFEILSSVVVIAFITYSMHHFGVLAAVERMI